MQGVSETLLESGEQYIVVSPFSFVFFRVIFMTLDNTCIIGFFQLKNKILSKTEIQ